MNLYLLYNGVGLRLMSLSGHSVSPDEALEASSVIRAFFAQGNREEVHEVIISAAATSIIVRAISAFEREPMPLHHAISELLNSCMSPAKRRPSNTDELIALIRQSSLRAELV